MLGENTSFHQHQQPYPFLQLIAQVYGRISSGHYHFYALFRDIESLIAV